MSLQQSDLAIDERRRLYNQLGRKLKGPGMPAGSLEQYLACASGSGKKFEFLKHFICDKTMRLDLSLGMKPLWSELSGAMSQWKPSMSSALLQSGLN